MMRRHLIALLFAACAGTSVFAADPAPAQAGKQFATVWRVKGDVTASDSSSGTAKERKLRAGDPVYVGESIRSGSAGEAVLKTDDAGVVAVRPKAEFVADAFSAEGKPSDSFAVRLLAGSLRIVSGWISHSNRAGSTVVTSTATIGIRGTDHEPYVLTAEQAQASGNKEGIYDKVNRGGTTMQVGDEKLDIDSGRVGFVRGAKKGIKERGLLTLLMPVLLDRVPTFYVPGSFDSEIDQFSRTADQDGLRQLEQRRKSGGKEASAPCAAKAIATQWIGQLDAAITRRDSAAILALFAADAKVRATVRTGDGGTSTVELDRQELADSTIAALKSLQDYKQRRVSIDGSEVAVDGQGACSRINASSATVEQGKQSGKPYYFESVEDYQLDLRNGKWLATKAETKQK
jgi:hypothetical protein